VRQMVRVATCHRPFILRHVSARIDVLMEGWPSKVLTKVATEVTIAKSP
jgi:hypothetical protein